MKSIERDGDHRRRKRRVCIFVVKGKDTSSKKWKLGGFRVPSTASGAWATQLGGRLRALDELAAGKLKPPIPG